MAESRDDSGIARALPDAPEPQREISSSQSTIAALQSAPPANLESTVHGVVIGHDGAALAGAHIALIASIGPARQAISDSSGRFSFANVPPGNFKLTVSLNGFATQTFIGTLHIGESYEAKAFVLAMSGTTSEVEVTASRTEIAAAELKVEETQRVFGIMPNFYVTYAPNALPLTSKQKFNLAWRTTVDPATFLASGIVAGIQQASNDLKGYGQGAQGYAKRYGANYADSVVGTVIGSAILASWWKQDPRYFYQGTGSKRSRALHAISRAVLCNGDNGRTQVNYSGIVGGLAAGGIANLYYPASDRNSAGEVFENMAYGTLGSAVANLFQEFVVRKLTPKVPNYGSGKP